MTKAKKGTDRAGLRVPKGGGGGRRGWSGARWASQPLGGGVIGEREDLRPLEGLLHLWEVEGSC